MPVKVMLYMYISRGYHSSVTSLTSLWSRASHIIASDEDLGDAINEVMTEILTQLGFFYIESSKDQLTVNLSELH